MSQQDNAIDQKHFRMTQASVERLVCGLALPSIIIMLISSIYNMADTFFVGSLGTSATGGVGVSFSLMAIIQAIGFFFGHGSGNSISRELGAQNYEKASKIAATGFFLAFIAGVLLSVVGLITLRPLALLLGATPTILPYAMDYLRWTLVAAPFITSALMLNNLLRFQGSATYGMIGMVSGAVLNIALDPLFIFVFDLGVGGASLATLFSQMLSFFLLLFGCTRKGNIAIRFRHFSPNLAVLKEIVRGGSPSLFRQGLAGVAGICLNQVAGGFGDAAIAAISVVQRVTHFAFSTVLGFGQGFQPVCGFNYGAGLYDRVKKAFWFCVKLSTIILTIVAAVGFIFAPQIIAFFRADDPEVIRIGTLALRMQVAVLPTLGWVTMANMMMQTMGLAVKASIVAVARQGLFLLPLLFALTGGLGLLGLQMTQPAADAATLILTIPLTLQTLRMLKTDTTKAMPVIDPADVSTENQQNPVETDG